MVNLISDDSLIGTESAVVKISNMAFINNWEV